MAHGAADVISGMAEKGALPDGTPVTVLLRRAAQDAARLTGLSLRQIEILALQNAVIPDRYLRNMKTLSAKDQARLLRTTVAMAGLGGLGGPILEGLARLGFGIVRAADYDVFEPSNLNRQTLATEATLGQAKAVAARQRVEAVNPAVEFTAHQEYIEPAGFEEFFRGADVAIDALGGPSCRAAAETGARRAKVPLIAASVAGWTVTATTALPGGQGLGGIFCGAGAGSTPAAEDTLGTLAPAINVAAGLVLAEAVRLALGQKPKLGGPDGQMVVVDLENMDWQRFTLPG